MWKRNKELVVSLHGGLGDQLFMYFSSLRIAEITNRKLILSRWTVDDTHKGSPFGLFEIIPRYISTESEQGDIEKVLMYLKKRVSGFLRNKVNEHHFFRFEREISKTFGLVTNVLNSKYEIGDFEWVLKQVKGLKYRKRIRLDCYFDEIKTFGDLGPQNQILPGLFLTEFRKIDNQSAVVHFRVGDILDTYTSRGVLGNSYYASCIADIRRDFPGIQVIGVSDNLERAQKIFTDLNIDWLKDSDQMDALDVLRTFVEARILVTANSGLSLWGARLGGNLERVYIPKNPDRSMKQRSFRGFTFPGNWEVVENDFLGN